MEVKILMVVSTVDEEAHIVEAINLEREGTASDWASLNRIQGECPCGDGGPWLWEGRWTEDATDPLVGEWRRLEPAEAARWAHYGTLFKRQTIGPWWQTPPREEWPATPPNRQEKSTAIVAFGPRGACLLEASADVIDDLDAAGIDVDDALSHQDAVGSGNPRVPGVWAWEGHMRERANSEGVIDDVAYLGEWRPLTSEERTRLGLG